jgi:DNA-binding IclR family transcriptional regulator
MASEPRIQSLARADAILGAVMQAGRSGLRLAELSATVGLNKTTVFNLVGTLVSLGYVVQDKDSRAYRLGPRSLLIGLAAQRQNSLLDAARGALERLCRETRETVNLAVPLTDTAIIVDSREGGHQIRLTSYAGTLAPYHATAVGKAILAFLEPARQAVALEAPMDAIGPRTITDRPALLRELERIRKTRRSLDLEEMEQGAHCVAVPIFDALGSVCAAISVSGLRDRLDETALGRVGDLVAEEVGSIERRLRMVE